MLKARRLRVLSIALGSLAFISPSVSSFASPPITSGLTVSLDSRGGSTISGTLWSGQDGTSKNATLQTASQYDAVNQYVTMNDSTSPNYASLGYGTSGDAINPTGDITVEAWVKFNTVHGAGWNIFATKWFLSSTSQSSCTNSTFHLGLYLGKPNVYTSGTAGRNLNGTTTITNGTWHQIAFTIINPDTRNGTGAGGIGTQRLYLDGVQEAVVSGVNVYQLVDTNCELILGDGRSTGTLGIDGGLEKFRMYNRALSADEINKNYRADANIHSLNAGPYNTMLPSVTGLHKYLATETGTTGTWLNSPTSWSYQWSRAATAAGTYSAISGATSQTYVTAAADVGNYLKVMVGAINAFGTIYETSTATSVIAKASTSLTLTIANQIPVYRTANNLNAATAGVAGKVTFTADGKSIPGCKNVNSIAGNSFIATCPWKPSIHKLFALSATFTPTDSNYFGDLKILTSPLVISRSTRR